MTRPLNRIEALLGAFAKLNGFADATSRAYQNRNPLLLRAFSPKHEKDEAGFRVFNSFSAGIDNSLIDLKIKCSGTSHSGLKATDTLKDLVKYFGNAGIATRKVKNFLRHALHDDEIYENTPLEFFMADQPKETKEKEMTIGDVNA